MSVEEAPAECTSDGDKANNAPSPSGAKFVKLPLIATDVRGVPNKNAKAMKCFQAA